jgi:glycosyltransferase involved in cell wall biosynthesis
MAQFLAASDACVAILKNIPMFATTYPNKVFDYMAAGRPTVLAIDGVIRDVMEQADGGIFVPPGDDAELAAAILRLRNAREEAARMGARARKYVTEHLDRRTQAEKFLEVTTELCGKR